MPQADYVNTVVAALRHAGRRLVEAIAHARAAFGRARRIKWGPRTLDIDILSYHGEAHVFGAQIPHPRLAERAFVLRPLADIAPGWRHPVTGVAIETLLKCLPVAARRSVKRLND